jgi:peptidoglycan-associated lipoprotein
MAVSQLKYFISATNQRTSWVTYVAPIALLTSLFGCGSHRSIGQVDRPQNILGSMTEEEAQRLRDSRYGQGTIPRAEGEDFLRDILFDLDSAELTNEAQRDIEKNAEALGDGSASITLEGHCDEQGTAEYNLALGQRRAQSVFAYLSSLGIATSRIAVISYGENIPLDPKSTEEAWARNRRVHFGIGAVEEQIASPPNLASSSPTVRPAKRGYMPLQEGAIDKGD